jgi:hypothetical protein
MSKQTARWRFYIDAGVLVRRQIAREVKTAAMDYGVSCELEEDKGLLDSRLFFTTKGEAEKVVAFQQAIENWIKQLQES